MLLKPSEPATAIDKQVIMVTLHFNSYVPPTKCERGYISFKADPGRRRRRDKFVSSIFLESVGGILPDVHGYIIGTSQRAD